jgi:hypothetical protein
MGLQHPGGDAACLSVLAHCGVVHRGESVQSWVMGSRILREGRTAASGH